MNNTNAWISVEDRLPPKDTRVLVWTGTHHWIAMIDSRFGDGVWVGKYENEHWSTPTHGTDLPFRPN